MRGHIRRRSKTNWVVIIELERDPETHKRRSKWYGGHRTRRAAEATLAEVLRDAQNGEYTATTTMTVGEFLRKWLDEYVALSTRYRTADGYRTIVDRHLIPKLGDIPLSKLSASRIQKYYAQLINDGRYDGRGGLSAQTVKHHHRVLNSALNRAVKWGLLRHNPVLQADSPRVPKRVPRTLDAHEVQQLIDAARGTPFEVLIHLAVFTGLRRSELCGLRWSDIDQETKTVSVSRVKHQKGRGVVFEEPKAKSSSRLLALSVASVDLLARYKREQADQRRFQGADLGDEELLLTWPGGTPITPDAASKAVPRIAKQAGLGHVTLHELRHTNATLMLRQDVHPKIVQARLGHATISTTMDLYSHVLPGMDAAAAQSIEDGISRARSQR